MMVIIKFQGGLGNQMFQYAFYKSIILNYRFIDIGVDLRACRCHQGYQLNSVFGLELKQLDEYICNEYSNDAYNIFAKIKNHFLICKKQTHIYENLDLSEEYNGLEDIEKHFGLVNVYLEGFWQSHKYFKEIESELRNDFKFKGALNKENSVMIKKIAENNSVGIHVRRGDFLNIKSFCEATNNGYYDRAIEFIKRKIDDPVFFIFSDDINWCKKNLLLGKCEVEYVDHNKGKDSSWDMYLMSNCRHNIIANSTFSWWGAYLNSNSGKIVIAPRNFGYRIDVPDKWIRL